MSNHISIEHRNLDAMPDTVDFRDRMYIPTLVEVGSRTDLEAFRKVRVPILNQGQEGACTGFGLATVANFLLRKRRVLPDDTGVSARMFYQMAKRYDEWPGEDYPGSSARGAVKGWHKHGICAEEIWPYEAAGTDLLLSNARAEDALNRPLGAYFRVNHKDLVAMHSAISEVEILFATARTHSGWNEIGPDGRIPYTSASIPQGGHAFAIVGYDSDGLWLQNSWGVDWGDRGLGHVRYDDWLANGMDVWVVRLGAMTHLGRPGATAAMRAGAPRAYESYVYCALRPHVITVGNNGLLRPGGTYGLEPAGLTSILKEEMPARMKTWSRKRILLYAHGGLVDESSAIQRLADYREAMLKAEVYPLCFIWRSDLWTTVTNILKDAIGLRSAGVLDSAKDFMLDRIDDTLEPVARDLGGFALWEEMKENARLATESEAGAARQVATELAELARAGEIDELHIVAHSAGAIFMAPLAQLIGASVKLPERSGTEVERRGPIESCTLWAPACTTDLFERSYAPLVADGKIDRFRLYTLSDAAEQDDDCAGVYHKSLLYLVRNALGEQPRIPGFPGGRPIRDGVPLLGLERDVANDSTLRDLLDGGRASWIVAPEGLGATSRSDARRHADFDDDKPTLLSTLAFVLGETAIEPQVAQGLTFRRTQRGLARQRRQLEM